MDSDPGSFSLLYILGLIAANAFLVAAEFALIAVRRIRIERSVRQGNAQAARVLPALDRLEELVFAAQVARSLASVALGFYSVRLAHTYLLPVMGRGTVRILGLAIGSTTAVAVFLALLGVSLMHATLGQQVPKLIAVHRAEWITANLAVAPLRLLALVLTPVTWPLNFLVRGIVRLFGVTSTGFHPLVQTPEELRLLVTQPQSESTPGQMEEDEREMLRGVFEISETVVREVMTPRPEVVAVPVEVSLARLLEIATVEGHSRLPVYEGTIDTVLGVVLTKDLLRVVHERAGDLAGPFDVREILRSVYFVPDSKPVDELLSELRAASVHLAIVLDEFGGTYGVVTLEDLLEEIVGEITDEFDEADPEFEPTPEGDVLIDGGVLISDVNERFGLRIPEEEFDTVGGYVFGTLGRVPEVGDSVLVRGQDGPMTLRVEETEERRVTCLRLSDPAPAQMAEEAAAE
ncbi:hemolysin family protein [Longimicrobium terrae]|uniref:CBS domain containing-hemolysin-like protein n=1 Tax=Longimicrobium terrae TaxID=1639882 RepID=A0A841H105_9BACT|nr:hemolysin family protein [Longimicrobium terrae]MBB4637104.1 CBS domain containing-hemolysin-like protein [Longimicrobium terrae]MBB6071636.1 CBS domain containing-hemolysin-like protein [Longimicrobium terrae]NNC29948.1 HlyC/CorC family transporter [Longimicrobium terrae]